MAFFKEQLFLPALFGRTGTKDVQERLSLPPELNVFSLRKDARVAVPGFSIRAPLRRRAKASATLGARVAAGRVRELVRHALRRRLYLLKLWAITSESSS